MTATSDEQKAIERLSEFSDGKITVDNNTVSIKKNGIKINSHVGAIRDVNTETTELRMELKEKILFGLGILLPGINAVLFGYYAALIMLPLVFVAGYYILKEISNPRIAYSTTIEVNNGGSINIEGTTRKQDINLT